MFLRAPHACVTFHFIQQVCGQLRMIAADSPCHAAREARNRRPWLTHSAEDGTTTAPHKVGQYRPKTTQGGV
jgi:hypothetical protein